MNTPHAGHVMTGRIKTLRGSFGFITADDGTDYFFHLDDLTDAFDVRVGDAVSFKPDLPQRPKGPRARGVAFLATGGSM